MTSPGNPFPSTPGTERLVEKTNQIQDDLHEVGAAAKQAAQEQFHVLRDRAQDLFEEGKMQAHELEHTLEEQIRAQPLSSVMIAAGVGFVFGLLLLRR